MATPIRIIVFKEGDWFIAQCLEVDVAAQGRTADEALDRVHNAFAAEREEAEREGRTIFDLGPAPAAIQAMFDNDVVERTVLAAAA